MRFWGCGKDSGCPGKQHPSDERCRTCFSFRPVEIPGEKIPETPEEQGRLMEHEGPEEDQDELDEPGESLSSFEDARDLVKESDPVGDVEAAVAAVKASCDLNPEPKDA